MDPRRHEIHPDIARAYTLPGRFYADPALFERAKERIFAPSWPLAGAERRPPQPGSARPFTLLEGLLDEPLLLARDGGGALRCLSNVCTHRGNLLLREPCQASSITCRYHGRRFDLAGRMLSMPCFEGVEDFPS